MRIKYTLEKCPVCHTDSTYKKGIKMIFLGRTPAKVLGLTIRRVHKRHNKPE